MQFKKGDKVICSDEYSIIKKGLLGVVTHIHKTGNPPIGIEWEKNVGGHSCEGRSKNGYGYYLPEANLELYKPTWKKRIEELQK